jgi:hypothetical protein
MEASVAGMPPAAAEQQPVQPTEPVAQPTEPVAPEPASQQEPAKEGLEGAIAEMKSSFDQFMASQKPAEEPSLATDLLSHLEQEAPGDAGREPEAPQQGLQSQEAQAELEQATALIAGIVQEQVTPLQQELAARDMKALADRHPDINSKEVLPALTTQINEMVELTGNPDLIYNAQVVERLYKVVKAEQADASAVPAEQAARSGASIETHAGQTQAGSPSPADTYKEAVYQSPKPSVFG